MPRGDPAAEAQLHALGVMHVVPSDADPKVIASVIDEAIVAVALLERSGGLFHFAGHLRADTWAGNGAVQFCIDDAAPA